MKRFKLNTIIAAALMVSPLAAAAQQAVTVTNKTVGVEDGNVNVKMDVTVSGLKLGADGQLKVDFIIEGEDRSLALPPVVYTGNKRYRYERRKETLSGQYKMPAFETVRPVKKKKTYTTAYDVTVPYSAWMRNADVVVCESLLGCKGFELMASSNIGEIQPKEVVSAPVIWTPDPKMYRQMVSFMTPTVEERKARVAEMELYIGYPVNIYEVRPTFGDNQRELAMADSLMRVLKDPLIKVDAMDITGYASPEGSYAYNTKLAQNRAEGFNAYLKKNYSLNGLSTKVNSVPEDWDGLIRLVEASSIPNKDEVLGIARNTGMAPDAKDQRLKEVGHWSEVYKTILEDMYPKLRRIKMAVSYEIANLSDEKARELVFTDPHLLSLDEMYRAAAAYEPGSDEYTKIYTIAAQQYPNDVVARNNAAAALLVNGQQNKAMEYLGGMEKGLAPAYINLGTYHYISGDLDRARTYFRMADEAGDPQGKKNLELLDQIGK